MKKIFLLLALFLFMQNRMMADSDKPVYNVIIDTDGALDDFRAINMFLAGKDFNVLGITCSQGSLSVESCSNKVGSLLTSCYHQGLPVGIGKATSAKFPQWNAFAESILWGSQEGNITPQEAFTLLEKTVAVCNERITLVALGSLRTYADWIKCTRQNLKKIEQIIWYSELYVQSGFNYSLDKNAYNEIIKSKIPMVVVSKGNKTFAATSEYEKYLMPLQVIYAENVLKQMNRKSVLEKALQGHSPLWDDLVPLYLSHPDLFIVTKNAQYKNAVLKKSISEEDIFSDIAQIFYSKTAAMNRIFKAFPVQKELYKKEYATMMDSAINHYGLAEWKAITLTNEVHGHTGIYSIIGAKAGIRACEYFNVGVNNLSAISFAGNKPPLSCFNDGIQISSGATIGQGLITIAEDVIQIPTVIFEYHHQKIKLSLKKEIAQQMQIDIKTGIEKYGMTNAYWEYIEALAKKYWAEYDRHHIFLIEKI